MSLQNINKILSAASQEVVFEPTPEMRRAKAAFWSGVEDNNELTLSSPMTLAAASALGADKKLTRWWGIPGFSEWWQNKQEFKQRLEYLAQLALDSLEEIMTDPNTSSSARVNSAKLILDAANKMPKKTAEEASPETKLAAMSRTQLEDYIRTRMKYLTPPTDFDTVAGENENGDSPEDAEARTTRTLDKGSTD